MRCSFPVVLVLIGLILPYMWYNLILKWPLKSILWQDAMWTLLYIAGFIFIEYLAWESWAICQESWAMLDEAWELQGGRPK